jgi:hypothetical protein
MEVLSTLTIGNNVLRARVQGTQEQLVVTIATGRLVVRPQQRTALGKREGKSQHRLVADSWSYRSRAVPVFQLSGSVYQAQLRISELRIRKGIIALCKTRILRDSAQLGRRP